jgi:hypothetical protein
MSQAVIAQNCEALTAELRVRMRSRIAPAERLRVCGWILARRNRVTWTEATLKDWLGVERAHAWGKFVEIAHRQGITA